MKITRDRVSLATFIIAPLGLLLVWEFMGRSSNDVAFFFAYPSSIIMDLCVGMVRDKLWLDALYTLFPAVVGLMFGAVFGGAIGFAIIASPPLARRLNTLVAVLGAFPVFAIAPMTLVWFGIGITAKVFLAFLSCVFIFLQASYNGGMSVPDHIVMHLRTHGFTAGQEFMKVRLPYAMEWITSSFKTAANLALLGVFIGEYITSERGLARVMLDAGGLYNVKRVLAASVCFVLLALLLMMVANFLYAHRRNFLRWLSVPKVVRDN